MSEPCEVVEDVVQASSALTVTMDVRAADTAVGAALLVLGLTLSFADSAGVSATAKYVVDSFLGDTAQAADTVAPSASAIVLLRDSADGRDGLSVSFPVSVADSADASDTVSAALPDAFLADSAEASDLLRVACTQTLSDMGEGADALQVGHTQELEVDGNASDATLLQTASYGSISESANASDSWTPTIFVGYTFSDSANASDLLGTQTTASAVLEDSADGSDYLESPFGTGMAWVMNTETAAMSWFDGYPFDSIAQMEEFQGSEHTAADILMAGPDGLYVLSGDVDQPLGASRDITAEVRWGFLDFGDPGIKRVDAAHFAVDQSGTYTGEFVVPDAKLGTHSYTFRSPVMSAPHTVRVVPGRGLFGRYWQVAFRSTSAFEVSDASVDVAISKRRL